MQAKAVGQDAKHHGSGALSDCMLGGWAGIRKPTRKQRHHVPENHVPKVQALSLCDPELLTRDRRVPEIAYLRLIGTRLVLA